MNNKTPIRPIHVKALTPCLSKQPDICPQKKSKGYSIIIRGITPINDLTSSPIAPFLIKKTLTNHIAIKYCHMIFIDNK